MSEVLEKIIKWSAKRPMWQRDCLRRLVVSGGLEVVDIEQLVAIAREDHGLKTEAETEEPIKAKPVKKTDVPSRSDVGPPVTLRNLKNVKDVNALAPHQCLDFGDGGLTVIYGDNAAGKSGYARIMKNACRARGRGGEILPNVFLKDLPEDYDPRATIDYLDGEEENTLTWRPDKETTDALRRISVFDTNAAEAYVGEKTETAFRPLGLDLLDMLANACGEVKAVLEQEKAVLEAGAITFDFAPTTTKVGALLDDLNPKIDVEELQGLATVSAEEEQKLGELQKKMEELRALDPEKRSHELRRRADRMARLHGRMEEIVELLSPEKATEAINAKKSLGAAQQAARLASEHAFGEELPGTGGTTWRGLWAAAEAFSKKEAYPDADYPNVAKGARCVLCQQELDPTSTKRLERFLKFVEQDTQRLVEETQSRFDDLLEKMEDLEIADEAMESIIDEVRSDKESLADDIAAFMKVAEETKATLLQSLKEDKASDRPTWSEPQLEPLNAMVAELRKTADELEEGADPEAMEKLAGEVAELAAKKELGEVLEDVLGEVERYKQLAALDACLKDVDTKSITRKSTSLTKEVVTVALQNQFDGELAHMGFGSTDAEIRPAGGKQGILYHQLQLRNVKRAKMPKIVSEGEGRCLALAAFLAEVGASKDPSAIIFDDPVSSLDQSWRRQIARRLVEEAKKRQVIVFSHDLVFLFLLQHISQHEEVLCHTRYIRRDPAGNGFCHEGLPWSAMSTKQRIGRLKQDWQRAEKIFRTESEERYFTEAGHLYGLLREAWERAVEEVLLNGVVERFRPSVETKRVANLIDIDQDDYEVLVRGMGKTSSWLEGHDQAAALGTSPPPPEELSEDIEALEGWVTRIRKRRK